ncbi:MAG: patatin-like phospholipase family protein [Gemmataceae bacterium]
MPPPLDLVFSGGGTRGVAHAGAVDVLEQRKPTIRRVVGTSAGAIAAVFGAAGIPAADYLKLVPAKAGDPFKFNAFMAPPAGDKVRDSARKKDSQTRMLLRSAVDSAADKFLEGIAQRRPRIGELMQGAFNVGKQPFYEAAFERFLERAAERDQDPTNPRKTVMLFSLLEFGGFFDPELFRLWLVEQISARLPTFTKTTTLKQFQAMTADVGRDFSVVAADSTDAKPLVLNHRTAPDCPVVDAVLMSLSVPLMWPEVVWRKEWGKYLDRDLDGHFIIDGGALANFPLRYAVDRNDDDVRQVMGEPDREPGAVIGLLLDGSLPVPGDVAAAERPDFKLLERIDRAVATLSSWQADVTKGHEELICRIGTKGHPGLEMTQTPEAVQRLQAMVNSGRCAMTDYLKKRKLF